MLTPADVADITHITGIFFAALLVAYILKRYIIRCVMRLVSRTKTTLDDYLLPSFHRPFFLGIILAAVYVSAKVFTRFSGVQDQVNQAGIVVSILWASYTIIKLLSAIAAWRFSTLSPDQQKVRGYTNILKIMLHVMIWTIAVSMILHRLGIDITPIVATLGVGGLAVGLALQDTLANLFAGFYIVIEKTLEPGDYIELEGVNVKGYIEEISWRTTRIKTLTNNRIIVPNSKLAQAITTDFTVVDRKTWLSVPVGISYDNNLDAVQRQMLKSMKEFVKNNEHCVKSEEPYFSFAGFGDSNINANAGVCVTGFEQYYPARNELIKFLKKELERHKISMSYPRVVVASKRLGSF